MTSSQHEIFAGSRPENYVSGGLSPGHGGYGMAEPPAGSRSTAPDPGSGGRSPPEAENLLASGCATEAANLPHSVRTLTLSK